MEKNMFCWYTCGPFSRDAIPKKHVCSRSDKVMGKYTTQNIDLGRVKNFVATSFMNMNTTQQSVHRTID